MFQRGSATRFKNPTLLPPKKPKAAVNRVTPPFAEVQPVNLLAKIKMYVSFTIEQIIAHFEAQSEPKFQYLHYGFQNANIKFNS